MKVRTRMKVPYIRCRAISFDKPRRVKSGCRFFCHRCFCSVLPLGTLSCVTCNAMKMIAAVSWNSVFHWFNKVLQLGKHATRGPSLGNVLTMILECFCGMLSQKDRKYSSVYKVLASPFLPFPAVGTSKFPLVL